MLNEYEKGATTNRRVTMVPTLKTEKASHKTQLDTVEDYSAFGHPGMQNNNVTTNFIGGALSGSMTHRVEPHYDRYNEKLGEDTMD